MTEAVRTFVRRHRVSSSFATGLGAFALALFIGCEPTPNVMVASPVEGAFVTGATVTVEGTAKDVPIDTPIVVNGIVATRPSANVWSAAVPLDHAAVHNRIVVELLMPGHERTSIRHVVAVDGVTTGGVADGDLSPNSVALRIENTGFDQVEPVISESVDNALDVSELVVEQNPLLEDECVLYDNLNNCTHRATATALFVGTNGSSLDATSIGPGAVRTTIVIDGLFAEVDLFVRETAGTANFTCGLEITIDSAAITADLDMQPNASDARFVDVNLSAEPDLTMNGYGSRFVSGVCDDPIIGAIINFFLHNQIAILTRSAFLSQLGDPDGAGPLDSPIAEGIETALAGVAIAGPVGSGVGAILDAPFASVDEDSYGITFSADSGVTQPNPEDGAPDLLASYALLDEAAPALGGTTPGGAPYDLAYGISTSALNQMLKAFVEGGMLNMTLTEFDLPGVGTVPLTVGLLATLIPEFAGQGAPETPVVVRIRAAVAPVLTGQPGPQGEMGELRFGGVSVNFDVLGSTTTLALGLDASFGTGVEFEHTPEGLQFNLASLAQAELDGFVTVNRVGADESMLLDALQGLLPFFEQPLADAMRAFPIPALLGLELSAIEVAPVADWIVLFGALNEIPTTKIENVVVTDLSDPNFRIDGIFDISEWRHRLSSSSTSRSVDAALRGFAGADACCTTGDKSAVGGVHYLIEFDVASVPSETWRIDLAHSIQGAFDLARENPTAADGGGFTEFRREGVVSASYTTSTGESGSFDFVPTPDRVDHPIEASPFDTHQPFFGSNTAVLTGSGDTTVTLEFEFEVRAHSDSNFWFPAVVGDKTSIRFGKSDTMDFDFTIGAYPGIGDRSIAEDGHKVSLYLTGLSVEGACSDGTVDPGEECDDGNTNDGDGCASDCTIEPACGDGSLDAGEECDDGNNDDGDGCASDCTLETGGPFCGDGQLDPGEECDDGNNDNGDGCASNCTLEIGAVCGNGVVEPPETCELPDTATCNALCMERAPSCGDSFLTPPELCEIGDTADCTTLGGGFIGGTASCASTCAAWDTSSCAIGQPGTCTVLYDLDTTFQITNTPLGLGDRVFPNLDGSLIVEYTDDGSGNIVDGPVNVLHYWIYNDFAVDGVVTVTTKVHGFAPSCNGETDPTWRIHTDPGFPATCGYTGNTTPVATGTLDIGGGQIAWDSCSPATDYWSATEVGYSSYQTSEVSSGPGCVDDFMSVGNVNCVGSACSLGGLQAGDNPQSSMWVQPLINGPAATGTNALNVSGDLSVLTTPTGAAGGFQSINVPNDQQSRTWVSWTATRDVSNPATTCN